MFWDLLIWSGRQLKSRPLESLLIVILIALGTGTLVTVLSVSIHTAFVSEELLKDPWYRTIAIRRESASLDSDTPFVFVGSEENLETAIMDGRRRFLDLSTMKIGLPALEEFEGRLPDSMHVFLEEYRSARIPPLSGLETARVATLLPLIPGEAETSVVVVGVSPYYFTFMNLDIQRGSPFVQGDLENENRVAILSWELATALFGDEDPIGQTVPLSANHQEPVPYTVIGIRAPENPVVGSLSYILARRMVHIPATTLDIGFGRDSLSFDQFSVGVDLGIDLDSSLERVKEEAYLFWSDQVLVESNFEQYREHEAIWNRTRLVISAFASIALLIALISILNLMLSRVLKRTSCMGLSMALGASRKIIFLQFMVEASSLGFLGALLGLGLALAFVSRFEIAISDVIGVQVTLAVLIGFFVSLFFGAYPAYLGSCINPVDALRTDS